jgi:hypothetical protein
MTSNRVSTRRRLSLLLAVALVVPSSIAAAGTASATITYSTDTPMILSGVRPEDLAANKYGVCDGSFTHVIRNVGTTAGALIYLDAAQRCGLKVILYFSTTVSGGTVYPSRVAPQVNAVKNHPALFGYLSVKEPSWVGINRYEIRSLYRAFRAADPNHPVIALFGDIPHFGMSVNPYTYSMANIVMVDWYPVETGNGGRSLTGTSYTSGGPTHFARVRSKVAATTPGVPVWLMVQTHKYLKPTYHKKQRPSQYLLYRQVRDGFAYLSAKGIAFHTWSNVNYNIDELRDPTMVSWMKALSARVRAGTFQ